MRRLLPALLLALSLALLVQTCALRRAEARLQAREAAHSQERAAQHAHLAGLELETRRLRGTIGVLERRPERALALVVEVDLDGALLGLINADRAAMGRAPLAQDPQLDWVATWRAQDMSARVYYAHQSPTGESAASVLRAFGGANSTYVGENIWVCGSWQDCTPTLIHRTFAESEGHRQNQERPEYTHFGKGVAPGPDAQLYVVELFSRQPAAEVVRALQGG